MRWTETQNRRFRNRIASHVYPKRNVHAWSGVAKAAGTDNERPGKNVKKTEIPKKLQINENRENDTRAAATERAGKRRTVGRDLRPERDDRTRS